MTAITYKLNRVIDLIVSFFNSSSFEKKFSFFNLKEKFKFIFDQNLALNM